MIIMIIMIYDDYYDIMMSKMIMVVCLGGVKSKVFDQHPLLVLYFLGKDVDDDYRPLHFGEVAPLLRIQLPGCPPAKMRLHNDKPKIKPPLVIPKKPPLLLVRKHTPTFSHPKTCPHPWLSQNVPPQTNPQMLTL